MTTGIPISQLPEADVPLIGTEQVPLVQDGVTKRVAVEELGGGTEGEVSFLGVVSPAALPGGDTDNWAPVVTDASRIRVDASNDFAITGLASGKTDGRFFWLVNVSDFLMTIPNEAGGSTASNRFACNGDIIVPPNCKVGIMYDTTIGRWSAGG